MEVNKAILEGMVLEGVFSKIISKKHHSSKEKTVYEEIDAAPYKSKFEDALKEAFNTYYNDGRLKFAYSHIKVTTNGKHIVVKIKDMDKFYQDVQKQEDKMGHAFGNIDEIMSSVGVYFVAITKLEKENDIKIKSVDGDEGYEEFAITKRKEN